jgi:hypothetical protein
MPWALGINAAPAGARVVTDSVTGATLTITNEGNCSALSIEEDGGSASTPSAGSVAALSYSIDASCYVTVDDGVWTTNATEPDDPQDGDVGNAGGAGDSPDANWQYDWLHTSQTLQDIINIDITKLRFDGRRRWNGSYTAFTGDWWAQAQAPRSWNHVASGPFLDALDETANAGTANGRVHANYHSDFVWCNFEPGQNFTMTTAMTTKKDGNMARTYSQNRQCAGTHKATRSSHDQNAPDGWCDEYWGGNPGVGCP